MSIFFAKTLKIRGGWGLYLQTPSASGGWGFCPTPPVGASPLLNPGCATGKAYEVLPPSKFWAGYATGVYV